MTIDKHKLTRIGQLVLVVLAGLFTVLAATALASRHKSHKDMAALLERYRITDNAEDQQDKDKPKPPDDKDKPKSAHQARADRINERSIFAPPKGKEKFPAKLLGVLGSQVFFEGENNGFEVGQSCKGGKIKAIGPDWVEVDFKGTTEKLYVFGKGGAPSGPSPGPGGRPGGPPAGPRSPGGPKMPEGFELTPEMIERFKSMPAEMREKALERMPEEIRKKIQSQL